MLELKSLIGAGAVRSCYEHPTRLDKCVKVAKEHHKTFHLEDEARVSQLVTRFLHGFLPRYEMPLVETDKGSGLVCELLRDADGAISPPLSHYLEREEMDDDLQLGLNRFIRRIIFHDLFFYDFHLGNFVVQTTAAGMKKIFFIDLKSLHNNGYIGFLKLERYIAPMARNIMFRRIRRLYRELGMRFPFNALCRAKFFSTFLVTIRLPRERSNEVLELKGYDDSFERVSEKPLIKSDELCNF